MFNRKVGKEYKNNWKIYIIVGIIAILSLPYIIGVIVSIPNDILGKFSIDNFETDNSWIGFFGSIISSVVSMLVLYITVKETRDLQEYNRKLQIEPILDIYCPSIIFLWYKLNDVNQEIKFNGIQLEHNGCAENNFVEVFTSRIFRIINLSKDNSARNISILFKEINLNERIETGINLYQYRFLRGGSEIVCDMNKYLHPYINNKLGDYFRNNLLKYINDIEDKNVLWNSESNHNIKKNGNRYKIQKDRKQYKIQKDEEYRILKFLVELKYEDIEGEAKIKRYNIDVNAVSVNYYNKNVIFEINLRQI